MTWFRVGGAGIPATLKNAMNAVLNKKFGTTGQNYPPKQWPDDVNLLGPLPEGTATGSIANFSDGADAVPCKNVVAMIAPNLDGMQNVTVTMTGRNLLNPTYLEDGYSLGADGLPMIVAKRIATTTPVPIHGGNITISYSTNISTVQFMYATFANGTLIERVAGKANGSTINAQNADEIYISLYDTQSSDITGGSIVTNVQIEIGSTANAFEPYKPPTMYVASLGRLINGGSADHVNGVGTKTYGEPWTWTAGMSGVSVNNNGVCYISKSDVVTVNASNQSTLVGCICADSNFQSRTWAGLQNATANGCACVYGNGIAIKIPGYTTKEEYETYLTNNPLTFVYMLKTPTEFTFDGQKINSLYGVNNFWNNAGGDTTVVYRRDIDLALQAVSSSRGLMMASRPVTQLVGEESDPDQVNELVEDDENERR